MLGLGQIRRRGEILPAAEALAQDGLTAPALGPKEGLALLNGTQVSTALALAGLFELETVFAGAVVSGHALTRRPARAAMRPSTRASTTCAATTARRASRSVYRELLAGSAIRESHRDCARVQDPYSLRCQPQVMGACLDLITQQAATLAIEANAVTDNPLVFPQTGEVLSGGNFHAEPVAFAADVLALACAEIGSITERRVALLVDPKMSGLPAFLTPESGVNSGFMMAQVTAAALVAENRMLCHPASVDSIPTSANQEDHVSMATHGARRLLTMTGNALNIVAIELLAACQGLDLRAPLHTSTRACTGAYRRAAPERAVRRPATGCSRWTSRRRRAPCAAPTCSPSPTRCYQVSASRRNQHRAVPAARVRTCWTASLRTTTGTATGEFAFGPARTWRRVRKAANNPRGTPVAGNAGVSGATGREPATGVE